jgi:O-antigen ligase
MAWVPSGQFDDLERRSEAALPSQAAILDQSRYSRRGIAMASAFVAAIVALAAGGQGLAPIFGLAVLCAMSPSRLQAMLADALKAPVTLSLFVLFLAWITYSASWSRQTNPKTAIAMLCYLPLLAAFVWCCKGDTAADRKLIVRAGVAFIILISAWCVFEGATGFPYLLASRPEGAQGLYEAKKSLSVTDAGLAVMIWPVIAALDKQKGKAQLLVALPILAAAITARLTGTSSIIIALLFAIFCYLAARAYPRATMIIGGLTISSALLAAPRVANWLHFLPAPVEQLLPASYYHRVEIWKNTAALIAQKPWVGWGMDASKTFKEAHDYGPLGVHSLIPWHPHNAALHIWLETGLVGAGLLSVLVLALTLSIVRGLSHDRKAMAGAVATIGAFCVFACVSFGVWQAWFLSTAFASAGLIAALSSERNGDTNAG